MDGIIPLWKERGMTSHDCVYKLRKILQMKKVGHSGTLDPDVDGVLPICIGRGTKVIEYLQDSGKTYQGEITVGFSTETEDASGQVIAMKKITELIPDSKIDQVMAEMVGTIVQIQPMYSAVKVNGIRLYEYARNGQTVERPERKAEIYQLKRTSDVFWNQETGTVSWSFQVRCGKGTYIRTLAVDIGKKLDFPAHMSSLTRVASGGFTQEECYSLDEIKAFMETEETTFLYPIERAIEKFTKVSLTTAQYAKVRNGVFLSHAEIGKFAREEIIALYYQNQVVSLYQQHAEKKQFYKPIKVLRNE